MQLGFTMQEKMEFDAGQVTKRLARDLKFPSILDIPTDMQNERSKPSRAPVRSAAKGVGKAARLGLARDRQCDRGRSGVRLTALPLSAEAVYRALREAQGAPLEE